MKLIRAFCLLAALPLLLGAARAGQTRKAGARSRQAGGHEASDKSRPPNRRLSKPPPNPRPRRISAKPKDYPQTVTFPGGVTMTEMTYGTPQGFRPLTLDLYQPQGKSDPRPVLVFIHGGNWVGGDSRHDSPFGDFPGLLASIAARGYVVASVNYRLAGEAHFPAAVIDVKTAIRYLRDHAGDYNLDGTRFAAWGVSAGGHLAAMIGVTCGVAALEPPSPKWHHTALRLCAGGD